jgi:HEAT repeat protein
MSVMNNAGRAVMLCAILSPVIASAQIAVPAVPAMPALPAMTPLPAIPPMPVMPAMPMIDFADFADFQAPDVSAMVAAAERSAVIARSLVDAAGVRGAVGFAIAGDQNRDDEARQRADEERQRADEAKQRESERRQRIDESYQRGQENLERRAWARAADSFTRVIEADGSARVDAALYWKAYALDKLNQQADALASVQDLIKRFPQSRWISDAKALELQVRQNAGQAPRPEQESDEELKLLAIQGLQHSDPEQAVPMLEKILSGNSSPQLKSRALFVLSQSNSPRARQVLTTVAKGGSNPDVQRRAIQYLGVNGTADNRAILADIYASSNDVDVKRAILRSFMVSGDKARMLSLAQTEKSPELRLEAVRQLGPMGAREELWSLYAKETSVDVKRQIMQSLFVAGDSARVIELANSEQNPELRRRAIQYLGTMGRTQTGEALVGLYAKEKDAAIKRTVINGLFVQGNAESLVAIARKETDPALKRELVSKLSLMTKSKVAMDYLMEILNK